MKHAAQVDIDHQVELLQRHFLQARILGDAGVVDQHVDAPELFLGTAHHRIDLVALRHVHDVADCQRAKRPALADCLVNGGLPNVADDDDGAFAGELEGGGQADALRGAGDEADLVRESWHGQVSGFLGFWVKGGMGGASRRADAGEFRRLS